MKSNEQREREEASFAAKSALNGCAFLAVLLVVGVAMIAIGGVIGQRAVSLTGLVITIVAVLAGWSTITNPAPRPRIQRERLEGSYLTVLEKAQKGDGIPVGFARMPAELEAYHTLIEGATGRGKTQILKSMVAAIRARGDTVVVVDAGYELHDEFGRPEDVILSIFDDHAPGWLPLNEIRRPSDWSAASRFFISEGEGNAAEWHAMARAMFAAVGRGYHAECLKAGQPFDHAQFFGLLTSANADVLRPLLENTTAASLLENERGLSSVRMTFLDALRFWEDMRPGDFSVRKWVETDPAARPSLWIPHRKSEIATSKTLISTWLDYLITAAVDAGASDQKAWVIIDELSSLGEIGALKDAVTELRKTGFRVVVGIQDFAQVQSIYGQTQAKTILNNLSNKVILGANDSEVAERCSKTLGDARNRIYKLSSSASNSSGQGGSGTSTSASYEDQVERVVLASTILGLKPLEGFVKWTGTEEILYTKIEPYQPAALQPPTAKASSKPQKSAAVNMSKVKMLQSALREMRPIQADDVIGQRPGPRPDWLVDKALRLIGGDLLDGERFRCKVLDALGWHPESGQGDMDKVAAAYESARQILMTTTTLDRTEIERKAQLFGLVGYR